MTNTHGRCVWCNGKRLTKGHIWPKWISKVFPLLATHHMQITGDIRTFSPHPHVPHSPYQKEIKHGHAGSRKPRNTCRTCNGEWMSRLETAAIPFCSPLFLGKWIVLDPIGQWAVASLLCLITMRVEFTDLTTLAVPASDRTWLMENGCPPLDWRIWIARYKGDHAHEHWCRHNGIQIVSSPDERIGPHNCNTQVTTLVIGELCAHLFSSTVMTNFEGYEGVRLTQIWPIINPYIDTNFVTVLSDEAILSLSEALVRETPPLPRESTKTI